jgi:hypothetical protein
MFYLSECGFRYSYLLIGMRFSLFLLYTYLTFVCLCHTYRNSVFVIPTLNISDVVIYVIPIGIRCVLFLHYTYLTCLCIILYLSEFGFRYSYFTHI